jgi:basic membrane lipoprotein Med (substrate-binding protein (PBP1-ABC) superfamily)
MDGARETNKNVRFMVTFIGSWFDPPKAKEAAFAMIDRGADVLYAERFGVSDAAKERGKLAIGNVIDTQAQYPQTVVASALWHMEATIDRAIEKVRDGSFTAEDYGQFSTMKFGGASLAPLGTFEDKVPAEIKALVKTREAEIREGMYRVNVNDSEPRSSM